MKNWINGISVEPINGKFLKKISPANGRTTGLFPDSNKEDIDWAVKVAKDTFQVWSDTNIMERGSIIKKFVFLLKENSFNFKVFYIDNSNCILSF